MGCGWILIGIHRIHCCSWFIQYLSISTPQIKCTLTNTFTTTPEKLFTTYFIFPLNGKVTVCLHRLYIWFYYICYIKLYYIKLYRHCFAPLRHNENTGVHILTRYLITPTPATVFSGQRRHGTVFQLPIKPNSHHVHCNSVLWWLKVTHRHINTHRL